MAAILDQLQLGLGGSGSATFCWIFVELICFPDLTQGKAVIDKKIYEVIYDEEIYKVIYDKEIYEAIYVQLPVDDDDATLEEGQDKWGNVCVFCAILSQMITICHPRF